MSRPAKASALIFLVAAAMRLCLIFVFHHYEIGRTEPVRIAISLAKHGEFADPYALPTGPTAHSAPLYPAFASGLYRMWGDTQRADYARFTLNTLAASAEYALIPMVTMALGLGLGPGVVAGFAGALIPLQLWAECLGDFEAAWIALFLEVATILFARWRRTPRLGWKGAAGWGALWGGGFLLAPSLLPVLVGFCAVGAWKLRPGIVAAGRWLGVFSLAALLVMTPWLMRNYLRLGGIFFIRDNLGLELLVSNHDGALPSLDENIRTAFFERTHPSRSKKAAREIRHSGEVAFERQSLSQALDWMAKNPGALAALTVARAGIFWAPHVTRFRWAFVATALAALASLVWLYRRSKFAAVTLATILIGYSAVYYLVQNTLRYEHPLWWIQVVLIGWAAHTLLVRRFTRIRGVAAGMAQAKASGQCL
jgi:hypothetical protein